MGGKTLIPSSQASQYSKLNTLVQIKARTPNEKDTRQNKKGIFQKGKSRVLHAWPAAVASSPGDDGVDLGGRGFDPRKALTWEHLIFVWKGVCGLQKIGFRFGPGLFWGQVVSQLCHIRIPPYPAFFFFHFNGGYGYPAVSPSPRIPPYPNGRLAIPAVSMLRR